MKEQRNLIEILLKNSTEDYNYEDFLSEIRERNDLDLNAREELLKELEALGYKNITEDEIGEFFYNL